MKRERYKELMQNSKLDLTEQEIKDGWHFCYDWDFLLINKNDKEAGCCRCRAPIEIYKQKLDK